MPSIYVFYGFSGDKGTPTPAMPNGTDRDQSLALTAETLKISLGKLFPKDTIEVVQAWTKDVLLRKLEGSAEGSIRQVHVCTHGDSGMLSLAYRYDRSKRFLARAQRFNGSSGSDRDRAIAAMKDEDAIIAGFFTHALDPKRLARIKKNHASGATWQIWGCYAGYPTTTFRGFGHAVADPYLKRFNRGQASVEGVAVDIAKSLGVTVTAAAGKGGLEFWHGTSAEEVERNTTSTRARLPFWLWNVAKSRWKSFGSDGSALAKPSIFQVSRDPATLSAGKPPKWLTDLYWQKPAPRAPAPAPRSQPTKGLGRVSSAWFDDGAPVPQLGRPWHEAMTVPPPKVLPPRVDWPASEGPRPEVATAQQDVWAETFAAIEPSEHESPGDEGDEVADHVPFSFAEAVPKAVDAAPPAVGREPRPEDLATRLFAEAAAEDEEDDFEAQVLAAMNGGSGDEEEVSEAPAPPTRPKKHDPFDHLHEDLVHAKSYDLGTLAMTRKNLGAFAREILDEGERPNGDVARPRRDGVAELGEGELMSALSALNRQVAALEEPGAKAPVGPSVPKPVDRLALKGAWPTGNERAHVGPFTKRIRRTDPEFTTLVRNGNTDVVFKDEEKSGADRMMTPRMKRAVDALAALVKKEWPGLKLRVTEAWDEDGEHSGRSTHYEGRGADLTVSDRDGDKLGRLAGLATNAGFDWVFYEDELHVHAAVASEAPPKGATHGTPTPKAAQPTAQGVSA